MKPGATTLPRASMTRSAWPVSAGPTATMRSPSTAMSASRAGAPEPSMSEPPRMRRDQVIGSFLDDRHRLHLVALLDAVHVLHAARHLAEDGVAAVEVRRVAVADVELAARGIRVLAARHRHRAAHVLVLVELGGDGIAGAAGAVTLGVAALDHEVGHHAMEGEPVVEALLGVGDEIVHRLGRVGGKELHADLVAVLERDDRGLLHGDDLLIWPSGRMRARCGN